MWKRPRLLGTRASHVPKGSGLKQVRSDEGKAVRCSRLGQHQRVLPLSASARLPLSQNSSEATMKPAIKPNPVEEATLSPRPLTCRSDSGSPVFPSR